MVIDVNSVSFGRVLRPPTYPKCSQISSKFDQEQYASIVKIVSGDFNVSF